jgi:alpha-2-macroglobulin
VIQPESFSPRSRFVRVFALGMVVLAACIHGPQVAPSATLAPQGPDSGPARTRGPFAVVYAAPRGKLVGRQQPGVTVLFSRAMRSIDMADDSGVPSIGIRTQAGPVAGSWRWTGTRGLLFSPAGDLPGASDFVVTVPAGTRSLDGAVLERPYTLEFQTDGPRVLAITPQGQSGIDAEALPKDPGFRVDLDQPVDPAALEAASSLRVFAGDGDRGESFHLHATPDTSTPVAAFAHGVTLVLKADKPLPLDRDVELVIADSLRGSGGPRPMAAPVTRTMRTYGPLRLVDFYCPRITPNGRCRAGGDVKLTLSTPVDPTELQAHLQGLPPARVRAKTEKIPVGAKATQWLGVAPKLGAEYKVTVTAGMRDIYGQKLAADARFMLDVEAPLVKPPVVAPPVSPEPPANAAPRPPPAAPGDVRARRERLPYRLDLGIVGDVLEANGPHRVPVGAINIPTYASLAAALNEDQATAWTVSRDTEFLARNALTPSWTLTHADVNEREVDFLDLDAALATHHGLGPALLAVIPPGGQNAVESLVTVTDLGVTAKMGPYGGLVWVTHLSTGKPVGDASVAIHTKTDGLAFQGKTDGDGLLVVPIERFDATVSGKSELSAVTVRNDAAIIVHAGDDWTVTKVRRAQADARLTPDFSSLSKLGQWAGMLFADRGVFRPGETAKVSGIVRVAAPGGLRAVPGRELRIELRDLNGQQLFDGRATCDDFGTFAVDVPVPKSAELGYAMLTATAAAGGRSNTFEAGVFSHPIRILAYTPDEFKVTAEADKPSYVRGDTAVFSTTGEYLYGAPMPGASVTSSVTRQEVPFEPPGIDGFTTSDEVNTGDVPETTKAAQAFDSQDGVLDAEGRFVRKVSLTFRDQRRPERISFDADVQDMSRRTVSARAGVVVHPGEFYVALRVPLDRFAAVGAPYHAEVLAVEPSGTHRVGAKVTIDLVERKWNAVVGEQPDGTPTHKSEAIDTVLSSCNAVSADKPTGCDVRFPRAGYFVLRATAKDARGNVVRASTGLYGTEDSPKSQTAWAADDKNAIKLEANKATYEPGETAKVLLRSPFREGEALVTVERNGVLWQKVVPIKGPLPVVSVPIGADFYPNAFLSVVAVRGRIQPAPPAGADLGAPQFRLGYLELNVNPEAHRLHVAVTEPKSEYQPGDMVDADVRVTDAAGRPARSALTFYVVDEGVLALTSYKTPDPLPAFVHARKLAVFALDNREMLARIIAMKAGDRVPSLGFEYALASNGAYDKGHDGGDGDGAKRADFRTTAFFEAGRKTDEEGKAHFKFKLPDGLTTFRVMAVAAAADDHFGSGQSSVTTYRHLMARPALPRFIRVGDALDASVIVASKVEGATKTTGAPMSVDVRLDVKGLDLKGSPARNVTMPRGGKAEVRFPLGASVPGDAVLTFTVRSGTDVDKVELKRKVELPTSEDSAAVYGETDGAATIALGDTRLMRPDRGGLDVHIASSALVGLGATLDKLVEYPYGCTEQLSSRVLPLLATLDLSKDLGISPRADADALLDAAVETILKRQNEDGGFGYWDGSGSEPWLSAYAMLALGGAAERKRFVPADAVQSGRSYLNMRLANITRELGQKSGDSADDVTDAGADAAEVQKKSTEKEVDFASAALIGDVLSTLGWSNAAALNVLFDARSGVRLFAQAALLHAMAKAEMSGAQLKTLSHEIESRLRVGPNEVIVDEADEDRYGSVLDSNARTLAMALRAFLAADPHHPLAARMARGLLSLRKDGGWRTTQEDSWALLALADYRKTQEAGGADVTGRAFLRGTSILEKSFPKGSTEEEHVLVPAARIADEAGGLLGFEVSGKGKLYYAAELKYETTALPAKPRDEGLFVQKYVRGIVPTALTDALATIPKRAADAVMAGDLVVVDLLFESAEPRDQVVLDDPLPAGLEALDYDLDTTSKAKNDAVNTSIDPAKAVWLGTTYRTAPSRRQVKDDRVLTFFQHIEPGMYRVSYLARATSIGTFVTPPTRIAAMYVPEVYGRTAASVLAVSAKP